MLATIQLNNRFLARGAKVSDVVPNGMSLAPSARAGVTAKSDSA